MIIDRALKLLDITIQNGTRGTMISKLHFINTSLHQGTK